MKRFLPSTRKELDSLGWERPDIILVTGDAYIDSPLIGTAVIGRVLEKAGFRTAIIAQPDLDSGGDISRLGEPRLFWGVTAGCVDSLVANYTALKKRRKRDDFTPGGSNTRRPDRAVIVYTNLIRRYFKGTVPIILGGIEASTRRIAHYDFWSDTVRRSILFDAKADILVYGMGEPAVLEIARRASFGLPCTGIPGTCTISGEKPEDYVRLPSYEEVKEDGEALIRMFRSFSENSDPVCARGMVQAHGDRFLVHNPPAVMTPEELDEVHSLPYCLDAHPVHSDHGPVRALDTIRFSIASHRGCYGGCSFCCIAVHQGRRITSRSEESILREASGFADHPAFRGIISDVGGPTANMYMTGCSLDSGCRNRLCLFPSPCTNLRTDHSPQLRLLKKLRSLPSVTKVFIASGIRHDLILADPGHHRYMEELVLHHVSGQLKIAPEHVQKNVLSLMKKSGSEGVLAFKRLFDRLSSGYGKNQFLTYYFIAAHPGCDRSDMEALKRFVQKHLHIIPEQVQIFTPLPCTWSSIMYRTGRDPDTGAPVFVERDRDRRQRQKDILIPNRKKRGG